MKIKRFTSVISTEDLLDVVIQIEKKRIIKFALNYRARIKEKWEQIYRVDNFHGFLHEHRFWRSEKPIPLDETHGLNEMFIKYHNEVLENHEKYKKYFREKEKKK